jgi:signal transduction histidine kinase
MVLNIAEEVRTLNPRSTLTVGLSCPEPVLVRINGEALAILCHNLISNAYLHVGEGRLDINILRHDRSVTLVFTDNGPGLPESPSSYARGGNGIRHCQASLETGQSGCSI